jgi:hypothetical protein
MVKVPGLMPKSSKSRARCDLPPVFPLSVLSPFISRDGAAGRCARVCRVALFGLAACSALVSASAEEAPLHEKIDALLAAGHPVGQAPIASDADFLRRAYLALHGVIPTAAQTRAFFAETAPNKRPALIETLLGDPQFARWMAVRFDVMLMERRAETHTKAQPWREWLEQSFAANKPWDALVREILSNDGSDEKTRHIARWVLEREADSNALAKDTARLFLGRDISCSQCHNHPRIDDYLQRDYAGIQAFYSRTYLFRPDASKPGFVGEQATGATTYLSVFTKVGGETRPRLPAEPEVDEPPPGEWVVAPNPKDKKVRAIPKNSRRALLAEALGDGHHPLFRRNIANRLWAVVFGSGLVEPLDLHHSANPPANPALLDLLAERIATMKFDMRAFIRELALTEAFQRSLEVPALPADGAKTAAEKLPRLDQEAAALSAKAGLADEEFSRIQEKVADAQRATAPATEELTKQEAEVAKVKKALEPAAAAQKKADDVAATKRAAHRKLADAEEVAAKAAAEKLAATPDQAAPPAKGPPPRLLAAEKELQVAEKIAAAKKATADGFLKGIAAAEEKAAAAKAKVDEAAKEIAAMHTALDAAGARREAARIKAKHAAQLAAEVKTAVAAASGEGTDAAREALTVAWGRTFAAMELLPLAPEQLCWSAMQATGQLESIRTAAAKEWDAKNKLSDVEKDEPLKQAARLQGIENLVRERVRGPEDQFVRFFGGAAGQPQTDFFATPEQALFFENGGTLRSWAGGLAVRAAALADARAMAEEVYLSTLTRLPEETEVAMLEKVLASRPPEKKAEALGDFAWALLTSTEFRFAH